MGDLVLPNEAKDRTKHTVAKGAKTCWFLRCALVALAGCSDPITFAPCSDGVGDRNGRRTYDGHLYSDVERPSELSVLMLGNSYTSQNLLPGTITEMARSEAPIDIRYHCVDNSNLAEHLQDARFSGTCSNLAFSGGDFDALVLQEQSTLRALDSADARYGPSTLAAQGLIDLATAEDLRVVLYLTWGRRDGYERFATFEEMQAALNAGYRALAAGNPQLEIAPVGPAFSLAHEHDVNSNRDPRASGSLFASLYDSDGSHPSERGTFLAAAVLYPVLTGRRPPIDDGSPLSPIEQTTLIDLAASAIANWD